MKALVVAGASAFLGACSIFALDGFSEDPAAPDAATTGDSSTSPETSSNVDSSVPTSSSKYHAAVIEDAPLAHFTLDEPSGAGCASTVATNVVCVYPSSGATRDKAGVGGSKAVHLDDPAAVISVSGLPSDFSKAYSIELWFSLDAVAPAVGIMRFEAPDPGGPRDGIVVFLNETSRLRTELFYSKLIVAYGLAPSALAAATWHHFVQVHATGPDSDVLYLDGTAVESNTVSSGTRPTVSAPLKVTGFLGLVDEIAYYDKALPPARIAAHYAAQ